LEYIKTETFEQGEFVECPECQEQHLKQNDYKSSKVLIKALLLHPIQVTRGTQFEQRLQSANTTCNDLIETIKLADDLLEEMDTQIIDHVDELKSQIDLFVEIRIDELNKQREEFFNKIDNYQTECLNDSDWNSTARCVNKSARDACPIEWLESMKMADCSEETVMDINGMALTIKAELQSNIEKINQKIIDGKKIGFVGNTDALKPAAIGHLHNEFFLSNISSSVESDKTLDVAEAEWIYPPVDLFKSNQERTAKSTNF
jgi:hypothetical protein